MKHSCPVIAILLLTLALSGCATAVNGRTQEVTFSSDPLGAAVFVDGVNVGTMPVAAKLTRAASHSVRMEKPGYVAYEMTTVTTDSGWTAADSIPAGVFPPLIFLLVPADAYLGGGNEIRPTDVSARLLSAAANPIVSNTSASPSSPNATASEAGPTPQSH